MTLCLFIWFLQLYVRVVIFDSDCDKFIHFAKGKDNERDMFFV